jgi:hypothetical protein
MLQVVFSYGLTALQAQIQDFSSQKVHYYYPLTDMANLIHYVTKVTICNGLKRRNEVYNSIM